MLIKEQHVTRAVAILRSICYIGYTIQKYIVLYAQKKFILIYASFVYKSYPVNLTCQKPSSK